MSANIQEVYSSTEALAAVIEATKSYQRKYNRTLMKAFEDTLHTNYDFAKIRYEEQWTGEKYYTWEKYKTIFYNYTTGNYPTLPEAIKKYLRIYYRSSNFRKSPDPDILKSIKEQLEILAAYELDKKRELDQIEQETKEIRRILMHQDFTPACEYVVPFLKLEDAGRLGNPKARGRMALLLEMFNYGFILGKRVERAKKYGQHT